MSHEEDIDARLSRLSGATAGVRPRADFSSRVMQRIEAEPPGAWFALRAPASRFLPVGMLAAALALVWAVSVNNQVNEAMASSDDTELSW
ncbi:MAG TPA: hypothetical protein VEQ58_00690 [Polyangiaceae bacterium]|nr:hypothetical protein [Polyangiaceae bacterium]